MYTKRSASGTLSFDLAEGLVRALDEERIVVPVAALVSLFRAASPAGRRAFGRAVGESIGNVAAARLAGASEVPRALADARPEEALSELSAAWALAGLGALGLERWGRALVLVVTGSPLGEEGDELCETMLESALVAASDKPVKVAWIERQGSAARFLVGSAAATDHVRRKLEGGTPWLEALRALHESRAPGGRA